MVLVLLNHTWQYCRLTGIIYMDFFPRKHGVCTYWITYGRVTSLSLNLLFLYILTWMLQPPKMSN